MSQTDSTPRFDETLSTFETLRERERFYRRLVELSPDMIAVQGRNRILFINTVGARLLGSSPPELIGRDLVDFVHPHSREKLRDIFRRIFEEGSEVTLVQETFRREDGSLFEVELAAGPLTFRGQQAVQLVARDISDRRQQDESLRQNEQRYRELVENANDIVYTYDLTGKITSINKAAERALGFTTDEFLRMTVTELVADTSVELATEMLRRKLSGEAERTFYEVELVARDGHRVPVEVSTRLIGDVAKPAGVQGIARDITDRRRSEEELKHTVSLLRSTLESTYDGILVIDWQGNIVSFNHRFLDMWDLRSEQLTAATSGVVTQHLTRLTKDSEIFETRVQQIIATPKADSFDVIPLQDGRVFERYSTPQLLDGRPVGRVWSFRDVTDRTRAEEALLASERRYRLLFERNLAGVYRNSLDGRILDCNDACARIFGYESREEFLEHGASDVYFDNAERDAMMQRLLSERSISNMEVRFRRKDGSPVWVLENMVLLEDDKGTPAYLEGTIIDITDRKAAEQRIEYHAYHDELTGLPNRVLFKDRLTIALGHARRARRSLAVMFLDLDQFKFVNDTMGHAAGDQLLWGIGERLSNAVREEDTVARLAGDEFTLLLSDLNGEADAIIIAQKILQTISQPFVLDGQELYLTSSIGIALFPSDGTEPDVLLKNADTAMYRAKELGRNNYQLCTPEMNRRASERLALQKNLRRAFDREEFEVHYQPIVRAATGELVGMEALVRWDTPERGFLSAAEFIEAAEETRLLISIGEWVLQAACRQARLWQDAGLNPVIVAVNLSARQFQQRDIPATVERILAGTGLEPRRLALEITENTAMSNIGLATTALRQFKEMGVGLWLDDLGTGQSSLSYLKRFPLDRVKIDQEFIRNSPSNSVDGAIVSAVIALSHALGLRVIAEGVENQAQLEFLRQQDCDEIQGHLISRPIPADEMESLLRRLETGVFTV
ncbi:MAG: PAS domain S-box protein [Acidobacteriota bacterium]